MDNLVSLTLLIFHRSIDETKIDLGKLKCRIDSFIDMKQDNWWTLLKFVDKNNLIYVENVINRYGIMMALQSYNFKTYPNNKGKICDGKSCGIGRLVGKNYVCVHNNLAVTHPHLAAQWHSNWHSNNKEPPENYLRGSKEEVWWKCPDDPCGCHVWKAKILHRAREDPSQTCRFCRNMKACPHNNLTITHPHIAAEWHPDNKKLPTEYTFASCDYAQWKCTDRCECHVWKSRIHDRTRTDMPYRCKMCSNKKPCVHNNLTVTHPHIAAEWHPDNKKLPTEYTSSSCERIWWGCPNNSCGCHVWKSRIHDRTRKDMLYKCPFCGGRRICPHYNLLTVHPDIAAEWHRDNKLGPEHYSRGSDQKVKWECKYGHSYYAIISDRTRKDSRRKCPKCSRSRGELIIASLLEEKKIEFKEQPLAFGRLKYDFVVNNKTYIEYDGTQHFKIHRRYHRTLFHFQYRSYLDAVKTRCSQLSGSKLIRISYEYSTKEEIKSILTESQLFSGLNSNYNFFSKTNVYDKLLPITSKSYYIDSLITNKIIDPLLEYYYYINDRKPVENKHPPLIAHFFPIEFLNICHYSKHDIFNTFKYYYPHTDKISCLTNYIKYQTEPTFFVSLDGKNFRYGTLTKHENVTDLPKLCESLINTNDKHIGAITDLYELMKKLGMNYDVIEDYVA